MDEKTRCPWPGDIPVYVEYHDHEWGRPVHDDRKLFEMLILEGMQAGLSWITVLKKREAYRRAFDGFDPEKIARYDEAKIQELMTDPGEGLKVQPVRRPVFAQHPRPDHAVGDVRLGAFAQNLRGIATPDADIVQHRPGRRQPRVQFHAGIRQNRQRLLPHLFAMPDQHPPQRRVLRVEIIQNRQSVRAASGSSTVFLTGHHLFFISPRRRIS